LTTRRGLPGSSLLGFPAILPGKKVAVGARWELSERELLLQRDSGAKGVFRLEKITALEGEPCALIRGKITEPSETTSPTWKCELYFSLKRRMPVSGSVKYHSNSRQETWKVKVPKPGSEKSRNPEKGEKEDSAGVKKGEF
jgi:hypothetical protein